jgi:hypothetical protein
MLNVYGYTSAQKMAYVLKRCGNELTRENALKQATSIQNLELPMLLPGIRINTSSDRLFPAGADAAHALRRQALGALRRGVRRTFLNQPAIRPAIQLQILTGDEAGLLAA